TEVEKDVLNLIRSLLNIEKNMVSNLTSLDEKKTFLDNMIRAGMIASNSSNHLSSLMEIRDIESDIEEYKVNYKIKLTEFEVLTGKKLVGTPSLPLISTPQLGEDSIVNLIRTSELNLELKRAELDDYNAPLPPKLSLNAAGSYSFADADEHNISGGAAAAFEDFSVSLGGGWTPEDGGSITAGVSLSLKDKSLNSLKREIYKNNIETAALNLDITKQSAVDTVQSIKSEICRIELENKKLIINKDFIHKYLEEMKIKYERGLIRELELEKAEDQKKVVDLDMEILNIDRYLLANTISSQMGSSK
ncbi:MAG: hypothetical protein PQJ46_02060, partial [Spirochaetales bacterium]|nr:hypothetical protein [Spirochaetales bacterium]